MRDRVTFVHAADLHLDAPFQGVGAANPRVGEALASATFDALTAVVSLCIEREVDFLVLAGDVFDRRERSPHAQRAFLVQMERLDASGIRAFLACGNHDPSDGWGRGWALPANVHVFSTTAVDRIEVVRDGEVICAVYGRSFPTSRVFDNLSLAYRREAGDPVAVGVLHTNVGADTGHENYAPCTLGDLQAAGMDYWALGHIHRAGVLATNPYVVYSGSLQGLNPKETGAHGCCLVELTASGVLSFEQVPVAPVSWVRVDVDVSEADDIDGVRTMLLAACDRLRDETGGSAVARLQLVGRTDSHAVLAQPGALETLAEEIRDEYGDASPWLWLDRLSDRTGSKLDLESVRAMDGFPGDLVRIADDLGGSPEGLAALVEQITEPVQVKLRGVPIELDVPLVLERARDLALDRLLPDAGER